MGLTITAHTFIAEKDEDIDIFAELGDYTEVKLFNEDEYKDRILPFDYNKEYVDAGTQEEIFSSSYKAFNDYRSLLCKAILEAESDEDVWDHPKKFGDKPLYEFVNFVDNSGMLGPAVCTKLHKDFVENRDKFIQYIKEQDALEYEWNVQTWDDLTRAFELAKDNGIVWFH